MNKQIVLIIGASSAIGCEIIRQIANSDTIILCHFNTNKDVLLTLQKEVASELILLQADLSIEDQVDLFIDSISNLYGCPSKIVFLAAPLLTLTRFKDVKWESFKSQLDVQVYATFKILHKFLPIMASVKYGKVVLMLSSYTIGIPPTAMSNYITSKYALLGLMKALASEYSSKQICINAVSPSMIETDFLKHIPEKIIEINADKHPQKRNGFPTDIAPLVKFLLSDESNYITGVNIPITGGS